MGFIESIKSCFGAEELPKEPVYRAVLFGDSAAFFENVCGIKYYKREEISLSLKKGGIIIRGEGLYIKKYCQGDVVICGTVKAVERV